MIQTFEEYQTQRYEKLEPEFLNKSSAFFSENLSTIRKNFLEEMKLAMKNAHDVQKSEGTICAYISVSFLNTSVVENKPALQIDFYNEEWVYGESFSRSRMSADFLLKYWEEFVSDALDEKFYIRSKISKVEIKSLFWGTLDKLVYIFACYLKYFAYRLTYYKEFDELNKAENFYVTFGTYLDWQEKVFARLPEIDLLNPDANEDTTFRPVTKKFYRRKNFQDLNLRGCSFEECTFDNFVFSNVDLADARFFKCRFTSTEFTGAKFAGGDFFECYLKDCSFKNCTSNPADVSEDEYFAPFRMYHCFLLNTNFADCDFAQLKKIDCLEK